MVIACVRAQAASVGGVAQLEGTHGWHAAHVKIAPSAVRALGGARGERATRTAGVWRIEWAGSRRSLVLNVSVPAAAGAVVDVPLLGGAGVVRAAGGACHVRCAADGVCAGACRLGAHEQKHAHAPAFSYRRVGSSVLAGAPAGVFDDAYLRVHVGAGPHSLVASYGAV